MYLFIFLRFFGRIDNGSPFHNFNLYLRRLNIPFYFLGAGLSDDTLSESLLSELDSSAARLRLFLEVFFWVGFAFFLVLGP
jgi:hypothetical protein